MYDLAILFYFVLPIFGLAISLVVLYFIIRGAVISGLRHARREQWTEEFTPEKATWLSPRQRDELAAKLNGATS